MKYRNKLIGLILAAAMVVTSQAGMLPTVYAAEPDNADLARDAKIVADCPVRHSDTYGGYNVAPINDGDDSTGWVSEAYKTSQHTKHWVYVDFGEPTTFDQVTLVWDDAKYAEDYKIQVSNTARDSDWHDRAEEKGNTEGGEKTYEIEQTTARYVRVYSTKNVTEDETVQLNTFSVFKNQKDPSDKDAVAKDLELLTDDFIKTSSSLYKEIANEDLKNVKASLNLPKTGFASSDITWNVAPDDGGINLDTGEVIRGEKDKDYTLTATVAKGDVSEQKTFDVTVKANKVLASRIVEGEDRNYLELNGSPFLYVTVQQCGTQQLLGDNVINGYSSFKETKQWREGYADLYGDADELPLSYLENMWEKMHDIGYKHMGIILKWRDWEPEKPGEYDWTVVDQYIEWCDKYDMSWDIVYFGSNSCGGTRLTNSDTPGSAHEWWMRNVPDYLDKHDGYFHNGNYVGENHCPVLKGENYEYIKGNEIRAIQALMNHLAEVDTNKRTATFQVMNEPDWHPSFNTNNGGYNEEEKRYVEDWISDVAVAIKASDYSLVTRINGGNGMPHTDYVRLAKLPGIDMCGDDAYTQSVGVIKDMFQNYLYDVGFPHIAENGGSYANTSSLVLTALMLGGGYHGWQLNDQWWDDGMADTAANGDYWKWQLGQPIKWREQGQDMGRLNPAMNKISDKLACAPLSSMAGFNIETDTPTANYKNLQMVDGIYAGYECNDASVALAVKDGKDVYLVSDSASEGDGTVNFLSYQPIESACYVGYYKDDAGVADSDKEWVDEVPVEVTQGEDGIYRVPVKAGQALKVTFGDTELPSVQGLTVNEGTLAPEFDANTHEYSMSVGAEVGSVSVSTELSDENAQFTVNGETLTSGETSQPVSLRFGETEIKVKVIWDGLSIDTEDNVYTIKVYRSEMNFNGGTYGNVALNKTITSPGYTGGWWWAIGNAVDGNETTIAQPSSPDPVWNAMIDLGGEYAVDRVRLVADPSVNVPVNFNVNVSSDGESWTTVYTQEGFAGGVFDQTFAPQNASYIMIEVLEADTASDCGWVAKEIEVYGVEGGTAGKLTAEQVADAILSIPEYNGSGTLTFPNTPSGFTVTIEKSSNEAIIAADGTVTPGSYDESVYLQFKVVNDADPQDVAYSATLPVLVRSVGTTPQNINLALNRTVTGTVGGALENAVDGDRATRFEASTAGYPQSLTVDLGRSMDINQIVTTWDASRPAKYQIWTSADGQQWTDQGTYELDHDGTVYNDIETVSCRYVKLEALERGPNTNVFALMELEVYNRMAMPEDFVVQDIRLSEGTISPAFDKNVVSYSAVAGGESITVTAVQGSDDAYVTVNGKKTMSGEASEPIQLEYGSNLITVSVQDPDNEANTVEYQIEVVRKEFAIDDYTNVVLNKAVTTPGFNVGYWHPLEQINDGDQGTFAQSSSKEVLDYQFDLNGCFMVDEFEIYTGNANRPTSFDVKTSLDGENWTTVLTVNNFDPAVTRYSFDPVHAQYVLVDNKTSDGGWMAVNEIVVNGVPAELNAKVVAEMLQDMEITSDQTKVEFTGIPEGYEVSIRESSNTDVIKEDGSVTHTDQFEEVDLTVTVANGEDTAEAEIHVTVQPETLTNEAVLEQILSQMPEHEKDQTTMILPEAPEGFTVTYRDDQDGSNRIEIAGNMMSISAGLTDFSLPVLVEVSGQPDADAVNTWHTMYFKGRSKTAQEVMDGVQVSIDGSKVAITGVEEGFEARVIASSNQNVIDAAGNVTVPDTTTAVDVYVQVTKEKDQTTAVKVFALSVSSNVDKSGLEAAVKSAENALNSGKEYTQESEAALRSALELARKYLADENVSQKLIGEAEESIWNAIQVLTEIADKELLEYVIQFAESIDTSVYTEESVQKLTDALTAGKAVLDNGTAAQSEVSDAVKAILDAVKGLERKDEPEEVRKDYLQKLVDAAAALSEDKYTAETWAVLQEALTAAQDVLNNDSADQKAVDEAFDLLLKAMADLELREKPVDPSEPGDGNNPGSGDNGDNNGGNNGGSNGGNDDSGNGSGADGNQDKDSAPRTGDDAHPALWAGAALIALAALIAAVVSRKFRR